MAAPVAPNDPPKVVILFRATDWRKNDPNIFFVYRTEEKGEQYATLADEYDESKGTDPKNYGYAGSAECLGKFVNPVFVERTETCSRLDTMDDGHHPSGTTRSIDCTSSPDEVRSIGPTSSPDEVAAFMRGVARAQTLAAQVDSILASHALVSSVAPSTAIPSLDPPSVHQGQVETAANDAKEVQEEPKNRAVEGGQRPHAEEPKITDKDSGDLERQFWVLMRRYNITLEATSGGEQYQEYVDNEHAELVKFATAHPEFAARVPGKETIRDDGAAGAAHGLATHAASFGRGNADCIVM